MTGQPTRTGEEPLPQAAVLALLVGVTVLGVLLDLLGLLLLPARVAGVRVPFGAVVAFVGNAGLGVLACRLLGVRTPAYLLLGAAGVVGAFAVTTGPGGDVLVPVPLLLPYLLYLVGALGGAGVALRVARGRLDSG